MQISWEFWLTEWPTPESFLLRNLMTKGQRPPQFLSYIDLFSFSF